MKRQLQLKFIMIATIVGAMAFQGCAPKPQEPHKMPDVRPPDVSKAIEIPGVPYPVIPDELVVMLKKGRTLDSFEKSLEGKDIKIVGYIPSFRIVQLEVSSSRREEIKEKLKENENVDSVVYQSVFESYTRFNDPVFTNDDPLDDWNFKVINAQAAWEITKGDPNVVIAVVDSGTLLEHEELKDKVVFSGSVWTDDGSHHGTAEDLNHGTHIAITAAGAGNNGKGTSGIAPECGVMPVQVALALTDALGGVAFAAQNGARVINISMGPHLLESYVEDYKNPSSRAGTLSYFLRNRETEQRVVDNAFAACEAMGALVVVAAGNHNVPGDFNAFAYSPFSLAVGAVRLTKDGKTIKPPGFSDYGYMVRVSAPGYSIYSGTAETPSSYKSLPGTSFAAPHVSGLAGLIISLNPKLTPREVRQVIIASAFSEGTDSSGNLRWQGEPRRVIREMALWRRAFLLLMGKDENLLLDSVAQQFMLSLIPLEYNTVWAGGKGSEKAVGAFIDARAALELAKSGKFRKMFAGFTIKDDKRAAQLTSPRLLQVYSMLKIAGRYAGSDNVSSFTLKIDNPLNRLEVVRDIIPDEKYQEWLEFSAVGKFRHFCKFNGEDYSQGPVDIAMADNSLLIKNRRRNQEIKYSVLDDTKQQQRKPIDVFYTIAGGNQPNKTGLLVINYTGAGNKPEEKTYYLYQAGAEPQAEEIIYRGTTGRKEELLTGSYDIKIASYPAIWFKDIKIEEGKTLTLEAGGYGKLLIKGLDAQGEPVKANLFIYTSQDEKDSIATGATNEPLALFEGTYFVKVDLDPDITFEEVIIRRGETTTIKLPERGRLNIRANDFEGKPLGIIYWVYRKGTWKDSIAVGHTNEPVDLPPGEYNVDVNSNPNQKFEDVKIEPGKVLEIELPRWGELVVNVQDPSGKKPYYSVDIYRSREDKEKVAWFAPSWRKPSKLLPPGTYFLWIDAGHGYKDIWINRPVEIKAGEKTEINVTVEKSK